MYRRNYPAANQRWQDLRSARSYSEHFVGCRQRRICQPARTKWLRQEYAAADDSRPNHADIWKRYCRREQCANAASECRRCIQDANTAPLAVGAGQCAAADQILESSPTEINRACIRAFEDG